MSDKALLTDPTNRVVAVFDKHEDARKARDELTRVESPAEKVQLLFGEDAADRLDTSPKWFADTDEQLERYEHELRGGNTVISVAIADSADREEVHAVLTQHNARLVTHFGEWITEMMRP